MITAGKGADVITFAVGTDATTSFTTVVIAAGDTGITTTTADSITGFTTTIDKLKLGVAGTAANYSEAAVATDFATALTAANTAMNGTVVYHLTSTTADGGLLFIDRNAEDGTADEVVKLAGVDDTKFDFGDIIA